MLRYEQNPCIMADSKFSDKIRTIRASRGLTQAELAAEVGISRQALAAIESGAYLPNVAIAVRLARVVGLTVEELFGEAEEDGAQEIEARWKNTLGGSVQPKRVALARVRGRIVALALPSAHLTLPVSSGLCARQARLTARVATRLRGDEIEATLFIAGCDPAVSIVIAWLARIGSKVNAVALPCSSGRALAAVAAESVHVAGVHLRDPQSGDYNLTPVRAAVGRSHIRLINFGRWEVGLAVAAGNPQSIRSVYDLGRPNVRIINREPGAGARQVMDEELAGAGLRARQIRGYEQEVAGHLEVAAAIRAGEADTGVTIRLAAEAYGLDFVPLREERYDLAILESELASTPVSRLLDALTSRRFAREVSQLCGYDTTQMGTELARINC